MQGQLFKFLGEVLAAFVGAWVFTALYPLISDLFARWSKRQTQKKINKLNDILADVKLARTDITYRPFRIILIGVGLILSLLFVLFIITMGWIENYSDWILCKIDNTLCNLKVTMMLWLIFIPAVLFLLEMAKSFSQMLNTDRFISCLMSRIARLRARLQKIDSCNSPSGSEQ